MNLSLVTQLLLAVAWSAPLVLGQPPAKAGNAENGRKLFIKIGCYQCHGREGQGGSSAPIGSYGPRLAPPRIPVEAVRAYVRHPAGGMPPYTNKVLSDAEIDDIYAFLKTIAPPRPLKEIPL